MAEQSNKNLSIVVLAAGEGKRMKSKLPKVLHQICGRPLISCVLGSILALGAGEVAVVVGEGSDDVMKAAGSGQRFVLQAQQKGTGDAAMAALEGMDPHFTEVMVLPGDTPLIDHTTLQRLITARRSTRTVASMLTTELPDPAGYGRVVRGLTGEVEQIVEDLDATPEQREIREVNTCMYVFDRASLEQGLASLTPDNALGEYYLTDVVKSFTSRGLSVLAVEAPAEEGLGINDRAQLAEAARIMRARINTELMRQGVTILDPEKTYIDRGVRIGRDTIIMPMVNLTGETAIGGDCSIGPCTSINDSTVGDGCDIQYSWVDGCEIEAGANVGPFSRLRPGCRLGPKSKAGSFVEMKKTIVGRGSKVPHLSYIGDAEIGEDANVGAGSITCNYDGEDKHTTRIGDRAFIGSDTMMVAPVSIGDDAVTGAGSVISEDVPDGSLAIERTEQKTIPNYKKSGKGKKAKGR